MSKKAIPVWGGLVAVGLLLGFSSWGKGGPGEEPTKYQKILTSVSALFMEGHFSPKKIDDNFSKVIFKKFLNDVDPDKNLLLQSDLTKLKPFETKIDDELNGGKVQFVPMVDSLYKFRMGEATKIYRQLLAKPFEFKTDEQVSMDGEKQDFAKDETERLERWRKKLKFMVLERFVEGQEFREKNKATKNFTPKADTTIEREARERVLKIYDRMYSRLADKFKEEDKFNVFVNIIAETMDPHSSFFPPVEKRAFDESMSGVFFGIGAQLKEEDGNVKIANIVPGGPAFKDGKLAAGDMFMRIAQGPKDPGVEISGFMLVEDVVKMIRGKEGTDVYLTVKASDGVIKNVVLKRDRITLDESYARSAIVNKDGKKYGLIYLPEFYANFQEENGARCAVDVANEIIKLKAEGIDGIIMDLRNNGGGSLEDVIQMVGLFIKDGPVVQVKDKANKAKVYNDRDNGSILYDGPLVVMVNEFSASASEIFAAAIQDYGRGIVIGSTSTYGKGTVQRNIGLDRGASMFGGNSELGTVKLTLQKFYRINGGATQLKGVVPDIIIPDNLEFYKLREKDSPDALAWDEIEKAKYNQWNNASILNGVEQQMQTKINMDTVFAQVRKNAEQIFQLNDKQYSLNLEKYKAEKKEIIDLSKRQEQLLKIKQELDVMNLAKDAAKFDGPDKEKAARYKNWLKNMKADIYLSKSVEALQAIVTQISLVKK